MKRRITSLLLALCMTFSLLPSTVFATETADYEYVAETASEYAEELVADTPTEALESETTEADSNENVESTTDERSTEASSNEEVDLVEEESSENEETEEEISSSEVDSESAEEEILTEERFFDPYDWEETTNTSNKKLAKAKSAINQAASAKYDARTGYGGELNAKQKQVYDTLVSAYVGSNGLSNGSYGDVTMYSEDDSFGELSTDDLFLDLYYGYWAFIYDYPEIFWAGGTSISLNYTSYTGEVDDLCILRSAKFSIQEKYNGAKSKISSYNAEVQRVADQIYNSSASTEMYDYYKAIHDWMCDTMSYNDEAVDYPNTYAQAYSSGPVFTGDPRVTCQGYGETFKVLCDQIRIRHNIDGLYCAEIVGYSHTGDTHMWNYVYIDYKWFAMDTLWDDQETRIYYYFLCGSETKGIDDSFKNEHIEKNYFSTNSAIKFSYPTIERIKYKNGTVGTLGNFVIAEDSWSFSNRSQSFAEYSGNTPLKYSISPLRYIEVFVNEYYRIAKAGDENTYNSMIPSSWGGSCMGMVYTAGLFNMGRLNWSKYDDGEFTNVNDYYNELRHANNNALTLFGNGGIYTTSGKYRDVTKLIEQYQVWQGSSDCPFNVLDLDNFWAEGTSSENDNVVREDYRHNPNGSYVQDALSLIQNSDNPVYVGIRWAVDGESCGHALLAYAWEKEDWSNPAKNGWYKVYVYDPNFPFANSEMRNWKQSYDGCYITEPQFIELNPFENKWKYGTAGTNANSGYGSIGCDESGNVIYRELKNEQDGKTYISNVPDFFRIRLLTNAPTYFNGTAKSDYTTNDGTKIKVTKDSNILVTSTDGDALCSIKDGNVVAFDSRISYGANAGYVFGDEVSYNDSNTILLPYDDFRISYFAGDDISLIGKDDIINLKFSADTEVSVSMPDNVVEIDSTDENEVGVQISNILSNDSHTTVYVEGTLSEGDQASIELSSDEVLKTELTSTDSNTELNVYASNEEVEEDIFIEKIATTDSSEISLNDFVSRSIVATGNYGEDISWELDTDNSLVLSGEGDIPDGEDTPWDKYSSKITQISIGEGISNVSETVFKDLVNVTKITIPSTVESIPEGIFENCTKLETLEIPFVGLSRDSVDENAVLGAMFGKVSTGGILQYYKLEGTSLSGYRYAIPESLKKVTVSDANKISFGAFYNCSSLAEVVLEEGIERISAYSFCNCTGLTEVAVPRSVVEIEEYAFDGCDSLTSITLPFVGTTADKNDTYDAVFGVIFGRNSSGVTQYYHLEGSSLSGYAYAIPASLTKVRLTNESDIPLGAFSNCSNLTELYINNKLASVGLYAFYNCNALTNVYFFGEQSEWSSIDINRSGNNKLTGAAIQYLPAQQEECTFGNHSFTNYVSSGDASCVNSGEAIAICDYGCGETDTKIEKALGHDYQVSAKTEADCGNDGHITYTCSRCGDVKEEEIKSLRNHKWNKGEVTVQPTTTSEGELTYTCTVCGDSYSVDLSKLDSAIQIITQPEDYYGIVGDNAIFTVNAVGGDLSYQWYYSSDGGSKWTKTTSKGNQTDTLEIEFKAYKAGQLFRCEISDADGNTEVTQAAELKLQNVEITITQQPEDYVGAVLDEPEFVVEAEGNGLNYQWYVSSDGGQTWAKSYTPGYNTNTLKPVLREYRDGYQYYCEITDALGNSVNSEPATMSVETSEITITKQPEDIVGAYQELYQFSVEAEGVNLKYQWYVSSDGGQTWAKSELEGFNTDTMNVRMYPYRDGYMYRCEITSGLKTVVTTREATLRLKESTVMLISSPKSVNCVVDSTVQFHVEVTGENLKYQWYVSQDNGANWSITELEGAKTDTLTVKALKYRSGNKYRCIITDESGKSVVSGDATLTANNPSVTITGQPKDATANVNEDVQFTVEAAGEGLVYQWYVSQDKGETWSKTGLTGNTTDTLTVTAYAYRDGNMYRCEIVDNSGTKDVSNGATLSVTR